MTRLKISLVVLALIVSFTIFCLINVNIKCNKMIDYIQEIKTLCLEDNTEELNEKTEMLYEYWKSNSKRMNLIVKTENLDEIDTTISRMCSMIDNDIDERFSEIEAMIAILNQLKFNETPTFYTIF
jgi:uncharacterized protein YoxC